MSHVSFHIGDFVIAQYKTGEYIGEIAETANSRKVAVRVLAVSKHPTQGDLHHPMNPHVPFFHQRKALSHQEIALMPIEHVSSYEGEILPYASSLQDSWRHEMQRMQLLQETPDHREWAMRCLEQLELLGSEYSFT